MNGRLNGVLNLTHVLRPFAQSVSQLLPLGPTKGPVHC